MIKVSSVESAKETAIEKPSMNLSLLVSQKVQMKRYCLFFLISMHNICFPLNWTGIALHHRLTISMLSKLLYLDDGKRPPRPLARLPGPAAPR